MVPVLDEWRLLKSVHPIFALQTPSVVPPPPVGSVLEDVIHNFETVFEFEMLQSSEIFPEIEDWVLSGNLPGEVISAMEALLQVLEIQVSAEAMDLCPDEKIGLAKLRALRYEVNRRHDNESGSLLNHAQDLSYLVWTHVTPEGFRDVIKGLEHFNRSAIRASSGRTTEFVAQSSDAIWNNEEIHAIIGAGQFWKTLDQIYHKFAAGVTRCGLQHAAMVHLAGLSSMKMLLASCSNPRAWRKIVCDVSDDKGSANAYPHSTPAATIEDLCTAVRTKRHKTLHLRYEGSALRHGSEQMTGIFKGETRISLLQLLELRARDSRDSSIAPLLSKKKKKVIAAILAVVLMRTLGSQWLQSVWSADNIFFLPGGKATPAPELEMPYFLSCVASDLIRGHTAYDSYIYSFAVLLLELELDQKILVTPEDEEEADEDCPPTYVTLSRVSDLRSEDLDDPYLTQIIDACLEFKERVESIQHESLDGDLKFRAAILRYIVSPLLERMEAAHADIPQDLSGFLRQKAPIKGSIISQKENQAHFAKFSPPINRDPASSPYFQEVQPRIPSRSNSQSTASSAPEIKSHISPPRSRQDFKIAIICALPTEADAVKAVFDRRWDDKEDVYGKAPRDPNAYATGTIGRHNVVLAHMPGRGQESAAIVAANCQSSFEGIQLALVVGICGGVPKTPLGEEILLGDVVISEGIIPYTFGRQYPGHFVRRDTPLDNFGRPNTEIRMLLAKLKGRGDRRKLESRISDFLDVWNVEIGGAATYPGVDEDRLFEAGYRHKHHISSCCTICASHVKHTDPTCDQSSELSCEQLGCDTNHLVARERLAESKASDKQPRPTVHFGLVASGSSVMKSGMDRDSIAKNEDVLAFEMEGAGVWDTFPCLIIKGVCDYADSHKNKTWQVYAAATAATCMKAFLENWAYSKAN